MSRILYTIRHETLEKRNVVCKSLQPCLYGSPNKHESLRFERPKTTERVIKLTLLEGMMKLSNQHVELLVEYVETLMSWIKPDNHMYNP